jgi:glycosyltransferase involved in cell wall biosynthesis
VVLPQRGQLAGRLEKADVEVLTRPLAVLRRGLLSLAGSAEVARRLARDRRALGGLAHEQEVALVHANTSVILAGGAAARAVGAPHLIHVREIYRGVVGRAPGELWPLWRRTLERADAMACVSAAVRSQFPDAQHAFVLHDGLAREIEPTPREEARAAMGLPHEAFVVAVIGRVSDWKGQDVLANALAEPELAEIEAFGVVVGDAFTGEEHHERALVELRNRLGLEDRLRIVGFRDDLGAVFGAADAVAVPSTRPDPFPNSALEAAAAGLPVVAAAHGGLPELVRDGETGRLVPPGDHLALARALRELADDLPAAGQMGSRAAAYVREHFGRERMLAELEDVYKRLLR